MRRVVLPAVAVLTLSLTGCGMISYSLTANLPSSGQPTGKPSRFKTASVGAFTTRVAAATDKAPKGSYERAPKGALAGRDYSSTRLDAEVALGLVNAYRRSKGLGPLRLQPALTEAARAHARDLARWDRISHFGSDGSNPWDRVKRVGYKAKLAAENVGTGQASIKEVIQGWKTSPAHNKNLLLRGARHMGVAMVHDPQTEFKTFWAMVIAAPM